MQRESDKAQGEEKKEEVEKPDSHQVGGVRPWLRRVVHDFLDDDTGLLVNLKSRFKTSARRKRRKTGRDENEPLVEQHPRMTLRAQRIQRDKSTFPWATLSVDSKRKLDQRYDTDGRKTSGRRKKRRETNLSPH